MRQVIILISILALLLIAAVSNSHAATITLPDGQVMNVDNLSPQDVTKAIQISLKSMEDSATNTTAVFNAVKGIDPKDLEAWGKLVSGTIKTICDDLSITVNDFVKTPVGMGVAALIAYQIMGEELLSNLLDVVVMIPLWSIMTGITLFLGWYFYSGKTVYETIVVDEKGKTEKSDPKRVCRYPWKSINDKDIPMKVVFGIALIAAQVLGTIITLIIVLTT